VAQFYTTYTYTSILEGHIYSYTIIRLPGLCTRVAVHSLVPAIVAHSVCGTILYDIPIHFNSWRSYIFIYKNQIARSVYTGCCALLGVCTRGLLRIDWFWKSGWLIHKSTLCTRIVLLPQWEQNAYSVSRNSRLVRKIESQNQSIARSVYSGFSELLRISIRGNAQQPRIHTPGNLSTPNTHSWQCEWAFAATHSACSCDSFRFIHTCHTTHSRVWHDSSLAPAVVTHSDSFIRVTRHIHVCDTTHPYAWCKS